MIFVTHQLPVNVPGEPHLDRAAVWDGLVLKADNALPFVPSMTYCEVTERYSDTVFDRDIDFRGQRFTGRITLEHPHRVTFTRIADPVLGTITSFWRTRRVLARCRKSARALRTLRCARATLAAALAWLAEPRWQRARRRW